MAGEKLILENDGIYYAETGQTTKKVLGVEYDTGTNRITLNLKTINGTTMASFTEGAAGAFNTDITIPISRTLWVSKGGNDTTGNGSISKPYLTVQKAVTIAAASTPTPSGTVPYMIMIMPGVYAESVVVNADGIYLIGTGTEGTIIAGGTAPSLILTNATTVSVAAFLAAGGYAAPAANYGTLVAGATIPLSFLAANLFIGSAGEANNSVHILGVGAGCTLASTYFMFRSCTIRHGAYIRNVNNVFAESCQLYDTVTTFNVDQLIMRSVFGANLDMTWNPTDPADVPVNTNNFGLRGQDITLTGIFNLTGARAGGGNTGLLSNLTVVGATLIIPQGMTLATIFCHDCYFLGAFTVATTCTGTVHACKFPGGITLNDGAGPVNFLDCSFAALVDNTARAVVTVTNPGYPVTATADLLANHIVQVDAAGDIRMGNSEGTPLGVNTSGGTITAATSGRISTYGPALPVIASGDDIPPGHVAAVREGHAARFIPTEISLMSGVVCGADDDFDPTPGAWGGVDHFLEVSEDAGVVGDQGKVITVYGWNLAGALVTDAIALAAPTTDRVIGTVLMAELIGWTTPVALGAHLIFEVNDGAHTAVYTDAIAGFAVGGTRYGIAHADDSHRCYGHPIEVWAGAAHAGNVMLVGESSTGVPQAEFMTLNGTTRVRSTNNWYSFDDIYHGGDGVATPTLSAAVPADQERNIIGTTVATILANATTGTVIR